MISVDNKQALLLLTTLVGGFQIYRTISNIFIGHPNDISNGYSVQVKKGLGSIPPSTETGKIVSEVYPPDIFEGGSDVRLPNGRVKYYLLGPESGQKVILIHGFSTPCLMWRELGPALANAGYRVLMYDHYGRGYSDHPIVDYNGPLYTTTLALLMNHVGFTKAHLIGLSMGGPIATSFADIFPQMVDKLILLAPAGLMDSKPFKSARQINPRAFIEAPSWIKKLMSPKGPVNYTEENMPKNLLPLLKISNVQHERPEFVHALLSTLREGILFNQDEIFKSVGNQKDLKILVVWGTADKIVPYKLSEKLLEYMPQAHLDTIDGAGHDLVITNADYVTKSIVTFLNI